MRFARPLGDIVRLDQLLDAFCNYYRGRIAAGRNEPATLEYYRAHLLPWLKTQPPDRRIEDLRTYHLTGGGDLTWHQIQAVQRLFNWADEQQITEGSPFARVRKPPRGRRKRRLSRPESCRLVLASDPRRATQPLEPRGPHAPWRPLRAVLFAMARTLARPGEIRLAEWQDFDEAKQHIAFSSFKGSKRRANQGAWRIVPITDPSLMRLLRTWRARRNPKPTDAIFLTHEGRRWQSNNLSLAVRRARARAGLSGGGEPIVAYSLRHTAISKAVRNGATFAQIAPVVGHSRATMTEWYAHLEGSEMASVIECATRREKRAG